jgi:hypothetical protein
MNFLLLQNANFFLVIKEILALCLIATLKCGLCLYLFVGVKIGLQSAD